MIRTQNLKTTTSTLALTLALVSQNVLAMENDSHEKNMVNPISISHKEQVLYKLPADNFIIAQYIPKFLNQHAIELKKNKASWFNFNKYIFVDGYVTGMVSSQQTVDPTQVIPDTFENGNFSTPEVAFDRTNGFLNLTYTYTGTSYLYNYTYTLKTALKGNDFETIQSLVFHDGKFCGFPAVAPTVFPDTLGFAQMNELAQGNAIQLCGQNLMAVSPEGLREKIPGFGKQMIRSVGSLVKVTAEAGAKKTSDIKGYYNIYLREYTYTPAASMGEPFAFSVYFEDQHPSLPKGDKDAILSHLKGEFTPNLPPQDLPPVFTPDLFPQDIPSEFTPDIQEAFNPNLPPQDLPPVFIPNVAPQNLAPLYRPLPLVPKNQNSGEPK